MVVKKSLSLKYISFVCMAFSAAVASAADVFWVGGASGCWTNAANWSTGTVPPNNSTIVFNTGSDVVVDCRGITQNQLTGYKILSGNVVVTSYGESPTMYMASTKYVAHVEEGSSCIISNSMYTYYGGSNFTKTGGGSFTVAGYLDNGNSIMTFKVEDGEFRLTDSPGSVWFGPATNVIASGASLVFQGKTNYKRHTHLVLPEGATLRMIDGASASFKSIVGGGDIVAEGSASIINLSNAPCEESFTGTISGPLYIAFTEEGAAEDGGRFVVQRSDQLADILGIRSPGGLGFKAGIGTFYLPSLDAFNGNRGPICLEDEDGEPVTVYSALHNVAGLAITGSGSLFVTNEVKTHPAENYTATGTFGVTDGGYYRFNDGFDLRESETTVSDLVLDGGTLEFMNGTDVEVPIRGDGNKLIFYKEAEVCDIDVTVNKVELWTQGATHEFSGGEIIVKTDIRCVDGSTNVFSGIKFSSTNIVNKFDVATAVKRRDGVDFNGNNGSASIEVRGGEVWYGGGWGNQNTILKGGKTHFYSNFGCYPNRAEGATVVFDGGEAVLEPGSGTSFEFQPKSAKYHRRIGANGGKISVGRDTEKESIAFYFYNDYSTLPGVEKDGGLELSGIGNWYFYQALDINGPFAVLDGIIRPRINQFTNTNTSVIYGTGDFRLRDAILDVTYGVTDGYAVDLSLAPGEGSAFIYDGASCINFRHSSGKACPSVNAGALRRAGKGSVLVLHELEDHTGKIGAADGDRFTVSGKESSSFVREPIVITDLLSRNHFVQYDEELGFSQLPESAYAADYSTPGSIVYLKNSVTLSEDASVAAVRYYSYNSKTEIKDGVTLTVGNGTDPAMVLFATAGYFSGKGTLNFGTSEGVFYGGYSNSGNEHKIYCKVSGSGGVSYVAYPDYVGVDRTFLVTEANDYTGGTFIRSSIVVPGNAGSFSSGSVHVGSGRRVGGTVRFDSTLALANDFTLAGWGYNSNGTLRFNANAEISGAVEIEKESRVSAANGIVGTLSGEVSGDRLVVYGKANGTSMTGEIALLGDNVHTGGTEVVRTTLSIVSGDALGTGEVLLDNGTLVCRNAGDMTISNPVTGVGTVRLAGGGKVTLAAPESQDGEGFALDLACKFPKIASLKGISSVSSSRGGKVYLLVTDDTPESWNGTVTGNVSIQYGDEVKVDGFRILVK